MPYITDNTKLGDPFLKKSSKLLPCQKEMILYWYNNGLSQRAIAKMFNVSRRLIAFIIDPTKLKKNIECRLLRGGTKIYYNKEKHNQSMKSHRSYKYQTLKSTI